MNSPVLKKNDYYIKATAIDDSNYIWFGNRNSLIKFDGNNNRKENIVGIVDYIDFDKNTEYLSNDLLIMGGIY